MSGLDDAREAAAAAVAVLEALRDSEETLGEVVALADAVAGSLADGGSVWLFGNGGSAADAQHIAAELVGRFQRDRRALAAAALAVNPSVLTAIANDFGFENVFARQLEAHARPGDVAIGISTSGASPNVIEALETASRIGLVAAALTGRDGVALRDVTEYCIVAPALEAPRIQECHILIGHVLCKLIEDALAR